MSDFRCGFPHVGQVPIGRRCNAPATRALRGHWTRGLLFYCEEHLPDGPTFDPAVVIAKGVPIIWDEDGSPDLLEDEDVGIRERSGNDRSEKSKKGR